MLYFDKFARALQSKYRQRNIEFERMVILNFGHLYQDLSKFIPVNAKQTILANTMFIYR